MSAMTALENRIPPPIVTVVIAAIMAGISKIAPAAEMPEVVRYAILAVLLLAGGLIGGSAFTAFARARTTINPVDIESASSLVTTGIYGWTRNPMYVALTVLLIALAVFLSSAWLLFGPLAFALFTTRFQIIPEERVMLAKFGRDYAEYSKRVRRWL